MLYDESFDFQLNPGSTIFLSKDYCNRYSDRIVVTMPFDNGKIHQYLVKHHEPKDFAAICIDEFELTEETMHGMTPRMSSCKKTPLHLFHSYHPINFGNFQLVKFIEIPGVVKSISKELYNKGSLSGYLMMDQNRSLFWASKSDVYYLSKHKVLTIVESG